MKITKLDSVTFDRFLAEQRSFGEIDAAFDLRGITFVSAAAMVQLAAACHFGAGRRQHPEIRIEDEGVRAYLLRAGFINCLSPVAEFVPDFPSAAVELNSLYFGSSPMLIEVTEIKAGKDLPDLLDRVVHALRHRLKYSKHDAFDVTTAVSEIAQNTFDHNQGTSGFLAMQVYHSNRGRFLEIGVSDHGSGLRNTLIRNPRHAGLGTDLEAIGLAIQPGVSEHDDLTRGTGLFHLLQNVYTRGGTVQIRSGSGKFRFRGDQKQGWAFDVPEMPGVQVAVTLPAQSQT